STLEPYYGLAEQILSIAGDPSGNPFEPPRSTGLPQPPVPDKPAGRYFDRGAERLGLHPYRVPLAVLSRPTGDRPACTGCGRGSRPGCPIGAKSSAAEAVLPQAVATGRCEIRAQARVFEITVDGRDRARAVHYLDDQGRAQRVAASIVVLAC